MTASSTAFYPNKAVGVYAMGKAAIVNMVQWLAHELMEDNIRVNAIAPSFTRTNMVKKEIEMGIDKVFPKKSMADPHQVAAVAAMICSNDGSFVNGETFIMTGGYPSL